MIITEDYLLIKIQNSMQYRQPKPVIFLDRDGTLNQEKHYLYKIDEWQWLPYVKESLLLFQENGYALVIVTNQGGIARGLYTKEDFINITKWMVCDLKKDGIKIDAIYACPHYPEITGSCGCRKPKSGMFIEAENALNLDLKRSWIIGDKLTDLAAGKAVEVKGILIGTGYGRQERNNLNQQQFYCEDFEEASSLIFQNK